jgi:hypothetical protein
LVAKRATLRWLVQQHPQWTHQDLADALAMSRSWVSKWLRRLRQADPADVLVLHSRTPARLTPPFSIASQPAVVQRILEMRMAPPENLQRVPGPEAILYYVQRDPELKQAGVRLPRSQTTIWKILRQAGCIPQDRRRKPRPLELRQPGEEVQFDLKDESLVPADPRSASGSMWSRWPISSTLAPRSGYTTRSAAISMPRPSSRSWSSFCTSMACLACSPLTMIPVLEASLRAAISLPP